MGHLIDGPIAEWLAANREELNLRVGRARSRYPHLSADDVADALRLVLPPFATAQGPGRDRLLSAIFDLVVLHTARGTSSSNPALRCLLLDTLPRIVGPLLQRPALLPGALSNAVENLGAGGAAFCMRLQVLAPLLSSPTEVLDAGTLLAWISGEARLRRAALEAASRLPPAVVLAAFDVPGWSERVAAPLIQALRTQAWHPPRRLFRHETLAALDGTPDTVVAQLCERAGARPAPGTPWEIVAAIGDFTGFGGAFDRPPELLALDGDHVVYVAVGPHQFRVDADLFGQVCRRVSGIPTDPGQRVKDAPVPVDCGSEVTSHLQAGHVCALVLADSHRVRIAVPRRDPL